MIRVCYYKDCGVVYGEKEPLSDKAVTYGLCPKHLVISQKEVEAEIRKFKDKTPTPFFNNPSNPETSALQPSEKPKTL